MGIYKRGEVYWYKFMWQGCMVRESSKQGNDKVARQMEAAHRTSPAKGEPSQQRLEIPEHTGGEVNAPGQQAGEGKFRLVRMKGPANFQEFLAFENDNGQPVIGVGGATQIVV